MKKQILTFLATLLLFSCSKDDAQTEASKLPPETQTGANTFGVTINGKVYLPRDGSGSISGGSGRRAVIFSGASDGISWNELEIVDAKSTVGFQMFIHIQNLKTIGADRYILQQSNFHNNIDSTPFTHIYFKIFDNNIGNYAYYGSVANEGEIIVTRFNGSLSVNWVLSGTFKGKFVRYDNPAEFITITDGRFDFNLNTLSSTVFP